MERQSNIELCRICSIILVLLVHSCFSSIGWPDGDAETGFIYYLLEAFSVIGVDVFVLLSGYFAIRLKKKSVINILYICFFYWVIRVIYALCTDSFYISLCLPISSSNWFVMSYIGLMILSPLLNKCEVLPAKTFAVILITLVLFQAWTDIFPGIGKIGFGKGYNTMTFIMLYLIGRYIGLYGFPAVFRKYGILVYIMCTIFTAVSAYFLPGIASNIHYPDTEVLVKLYIYNNPVTIVSAVAFFSIFATRRMEYNRYINHIARSTLAVLLFHTSDAVFPSMNRYFSGIAENMTGIRAVSMWIAGTAGLFIISVAVDQLRIFSYSLLMKRYGTNM